MKLSDLNPNPMNPRRASDERLEMLRKSVETFGDLSGIVYNRVTGNIVGGHQRIKVLDPDTEIQLTKEYKTPTEKGTISEGFIIVDGEEMKFREVLWDADVEAAAMIAANRGAGDWDYTKLSTIVLDLDHKNFDLKLTMFDPTECERLFGGWDNGKENIKDIEANLDGITHTIKVKCPQEIKDEVAIYLKAKLLEVSFEGVEVV